MLNLATLALMTLLSLGMFFASTVFLSRLMPGHAALRWWLAGASCMLVGGLLLTLRDTAPAFLPIVLGNTLGLVGMGLTVIAMRRTVGLTAPYRWLWPVAGLNVVLTLFFTYVVDEVYVRIVFNAILVAGVFGYGSWSLLRGHTTGQGWLVRVTGVIFGFGTLTYLARVVLAIDDPLRMEPSATPGPAIALPYFYGIVLFVWLSVLVANLVSYQIRAELIAERDEAEAAHCRLERISRTDHLTGVANRRRTTEALSDEISRTSSGGTTLSIVELDLDHFKRVNDTQGHAVGDALLVTVAHALQQAVPGGATVGRWGGEEFLILLPGVSGPAATRIADLLRCTVQQASQASGIAITASLGVATWRTGEGEEALLRRADQALYRAKRAGRDCAVTG